MTTQTDIVNLALQAFGSRTTVTAAELAANSSNEAIQANLTFGNTRDSLLRMAPWDCGLNAANLTYITSVPGTPENTSTATALWQKGQPMPPWAYEYQYPNDCLKACWVIPAIQTGFAGIPITTAVTGGASSLLIGGPIRYRVGIDQFVPVTAAVVAAGGTGHAVGDVITLPGTVAGSAPIGAPAQLLVTAAPAGIITTVSVISQVIDAGAVPLGGSYFAAQTNPVSQDTTTGVGIGATFTLTYGAKTSQRVILTNQEFATLAYVKQVTDPNIWDPLFQDAMANTLGANLCIALGGDKGMANLCIGLANNSIMEARKADSNESLTINDITPDFIRVRGGLFTSGASSGVFSSFDWGGMLPSF